MIDMLDMLGETVDVEGPFVGPLTSTGRQTKKWTKEVGQALGAKGEKGRRGELFVKKVIESWGWEVVDHSEDAEKQQAGIDLSIRKPSWYNSYDIDVKANMNEYGTFWVDTTPKGWLLNPNKKNHRVWHVNVDTGWMAWYGREDMKRYIMEQGLGGDDSIKIPANLKLPFITRSRGHV